MLYVSVGTFVGCLVVDLFDLLCKPCRFRIQQYYITHNSGIMCHGLSAFRSHILNDIKASALLVRPSPTTLCALAKTQQANGFDRIDFGAVVCVFLVCHYN